MYASGDSEPARRRRPGRSNAMYKNVHIIGVNTPKARNDVRFQPRSIQPVMHSVTNVVLAFLPTILV